MFRSDEYWMFLYAIYLSSIGLRFELRFDYYFVTGGQVLVIKAGGQVMIFSFCIRSMISALLASKSAIWKNYFEFVFQNDVFCCKFLIWQDNESKLKYKNKNRIFSIVGLKWSVAHAHSRIVGFALIIFNTHVQNNLNLYPIND